MILRRNNFEFELSPLFFIITTTLLFFDKSGYMAFSLLFSLAHEMGHIASMYIIKKPPKAIHINFYGFEIITKSFSNLESILISISGPIINILSGALIYLIYDNGKIDLVIINFAIALLNLIPINNLDGGDILKNILSLLKVRNAELITYILSLICSIVIICFGVMFVLNGNLYILILGVYLFISNFIKND